MNETETEIITAETGTIALLNKSEIDQQIATAHRFPRSLKKFLNESLELATLDDETAEECIYALKRDGKTIEGPSARFAEIVAMSWGNNRAGARIVEEGREFVTAQGVFHDLERNVAITYEVKRRITTRSGQRFGADMIGVTANAACSIALRNAVLKGVPKALWRKTYESARRAIMGDFQTLANRRTSAIHAFAKFGVDEKAVIGWLNRPSLDEVSLDDLVLLRGLLTAIKEGETTPEQAFSSQPPERANAVPLSERLAAAKDGASASNQTGFSHAHVINEIDGAINGGASQSNDEIQDNVNPNAHHDDSSLHHEAAPAPSDPASTTGGAGDNFPGDAAALPDNWQVEYVGVLRRARQQDSLKKFSAQFWDQYGGREKYAKTDDGKEAAAIFMAFEMGFGDRAAIDAQLREIGVL